MHGATLHDGTEVVVKVQYPEVEKNFRMDFRTIMAVFRVVNKVLIEPLEAMYDGFTAEFDYRLEAAHLREMYDQVPLCF